MLLVSIYAGSNTLDTQIVRLHVYVLHPKQGLGQRSLGLRLMERTVFGPRQNVIEHDGGAMKLVCDNSWDELLKSWPNAPRFVAVAYFSCDEDLEFSPGDVLVVDASDKAISSAQTSAKILQRVLKSGAKVYSRPDLHAKVYTLGGDVFVGSANASLNARLSLVECLAHSDDPIAVSEARRFVEGLAVDADTVDYAFVKRALAMPVAERPFGKRQRKRLGTPSSVRSWLLGMCDVDFLENAGKIERDSKRYQTWLSAGEAADWFWWPANGSRFYKEACEYDFFIEIWRDSRGVKDARNVRVYPPRMIDKITRLSGDKFRVYHFAKMNARGDRSISWQRFVRLLSELGWERKISFGSAREIPVETARLLLRAWPK